MLLNLLEKEDYEGIKKAYAERGAPVLRKLVSFSYGMTDVSSARAIRAVGIISEEMTPEKARSFVQKLLWMMRDESGGNAWSAPELIGEILRAHPEELKDVIPVLASFSEEGFFRAGVLRALLRIADVRPEIVRPILKDISGYLGSEDPEVK